MNRLLSKTKNPPSLKLSCLLADSRQAGSPSLKLRRAKRGFTFIEVIIIFTIILIMTGVMMSLSYKERASKEITTVAGEVVASIREAQNNALTGKQRNNTQLPCAFKFGLVNPDSNDPTKYSAYRMFYSGRSMDTGCPVDDATGVNTSFFDVITLPKNVTISANAVDTNGTTHVKDHVIFTVPYGGFIVKDDGSDNNEYDGIDIFIEKNGKRYHICVHETGLMEELGFAGNPTVDVVCVF